MPYGISLFYRAAAPKEQLCHLVFHYSTKLLLLRSNYAIGISLFYKAAAPKEQLRYLIFHSTKRLLRGSNCAN